MGWFSIRCLQPARWHNIFIRSLLRCLGHKALPLWIGSSLRFLYTMGWASNSAVGQTTGQPVHGTTGWVAYDERNVFRWQYHLYCSAVRSNPDDCAPDPDFG